MLYCSTLFVSDFLREIARQAGPVDLFVHCAFWLDYTAGLGGPLIRAGIGGQWVSGSRFEVMIGQADVQQLQRPAHVNLYGFACDAEHNPDFGVGQTAIPL